VDLVIGFGSRIVGSRNCTRLGVFAGVSLVPRIQSVGFDGGCHGQDGCSSKGLVQDDVILKCSHCDDDVDQRLNVDL
jgi:hypothetical protein